MDIQKKRPSVYERRQEAEVGARHRFQLAVAWAERNLPDEHPHLAASTCLTLRLSGSWPTPDGVRARLAVQGRAA